MVVPFREKKCLATKDKFSLTSQIMSPGYLIDTTGQGDSSVFVLSRTGHFGYSSIHNSVNIIGRTFMLHLHGSCHICVSMCDQHFFVNNFN